MAGPTYDYFGSSPVQIVMQATASFDGSAYPLNTIATISPGVAVFAPVASCGLFNFHTRPLQVNSITASPGVTVTTTLVLSDAVTEIPVSAFPISVPVGCALKFVGVGGSGTKVIVVSAVEFVPGTNLV